MNRNSAVKLLQHHRDWLKNLKSKGDVGRAQNIVVGCMQFLNSAGKSPQSWLDRKKNRRTIIRDIQAAHTNPAGRKVLLGLIDFTMSEIEAHVWLDDFMADALQVGKWDTKYLTEAQKKAMQDGRKRARKKEEEDERNRAEEVRNRLRK